MQVNHTYNLDRKISYFFTSYKAKFIAKKVGATLRKPRKFSCIDIIISFWKLQSIGEFSYDKWAEQIGILRNTTISGQALWKRIRPEIIDLLKILVNKSFKQKFGTFIDGKVFKHFENVLIQDATHFKMPKSMAVYFPGSYSRYGKSSTAKVQATFNLKKGIYSDFTLSSFRNNDQKESPEILKQIRKKDLIIRDLGYFVLKVFSLIDKKGAYYLSRLKYGISIFDEETSEKISLIKLLKKCNGPIDMIVKLGEKEKLKCRLVAIPVPEKVANQRKRKAKLERNKKSNHSKKYYKLLEYTFFITNVLDDIWSAEDISDAYRSRWYIETLFKGWKSNLKMKNNVPPKHITKTRVEFFIYASLLMTNILVLPVFLLVNKTVECTMKKSISIIKLCSYISNNIALIIQNNSMENLISHAKYSCLYESRKSRKNSLELMQTYPLG